VEGFVTDRCVVTFRAPAEQLSALVPAPLTLDTQHGYGFLSVCALEVSSMGLAVTPAWLRFHNVELLYRIGVRLDGRPSFLTLASDTSSRALATLGGLFSHYRLRRAPVRIARRGGRLAFERPGGDGRGAELEVELEERGDAADGSVFPSAEAADRFLLGMDFSVDRDLRGRMQTQRIEHSPWQARFVRATRVSFEFVRAFGAAHDLSLDYDGTLHMRGIHQRWCAARWHHE
jgi:uncharacterized protein YqjF (DUF2071 family)